MMWHLVIKVTKKAKYKGKTYLSNNGKLINRMQERTLTSLLANFSAKFCWPEASGMVY